MNDESRGRPASRTLRSAALLPLIFCLAWQDPQPGGAPLESYRARMSTTSSQPRTAAPASARGSASSVPMILIDSVAQPSPAQPGQSPRSALLTGVDVSQLPPPGQILAEIPDPVHAEQILTTRLTEIRDTVRESRVIKNYERVVDKSREYLRALNRASSMRLSLEECVQRALDGSYTIRAGSYGPAIARNHIVSAEAAFDGVFFLETNWAARDQATASDLASSFSDTRVYEGGFRQLLPTGMQVQTSLAHTRTFTNLSFATINPAYESRFTVAFTQPLMRGFGLDYNRAPIELAKLDHRISYETFVRQVRETLMNVERAYWQLAQLRRLAFILAESVAQNYVTYKNMEERQTHDASPVELANSRSRWKNRETDLIEVFQRIRDAEDVLKNLMNDGELTLASSVAIIPTDEPLVSPLVLDLLAEVRTAVDNRSEIREAKLRVEQSRVRTARAKNETLPQLNLNFTYEVQGLEQSADQSFDRLTANRFRSYSVGVSFSYPIGNRGPRADLRSARFAEAQTVVQLRASMDNVVQEVNAAVRDLELRFEQIPAAYEAVYNANLNLRALQARSLQVSPEYLNTELSGVENVANTRQRLLQILTDLNVALVELERSKGTLLNYNNVVLADAADGR